MKKRVLFLCTHNSARSQMAEGILRHEGGTAFEVFSAGTEPGGVHAMAVEVMREAGINISGQRSKHLDEFLNQSFDYVITVCDKARESCPRLPTHREQINWSFDDPSALHDPEARLRAFRRIRDELTRRLRLLMNLYAEPVRLNDR